MKTSYAVFFIDIFYNFVVEQRIDEDNISKHIRVSSKFYTQRFLVFDLLSSIQFVGVFIPFSEGYLNRVVY